MRRNWVPKMAPRVVKDVSNSTNPLVPVVQPFPPRLKQAMYAAAASGTVKRRTWDDCAFNAAGQQVGELINSNLKAAEVFQITSNKVRSFINQWDILVGTDEECCQVLREAIEEVGLFTEPTKLGGLVSVHVGYVHKSEETKMKEEFDKIVSDIHDYHDEDLDKVALELKEDVENVALLLST